MIDWLDVCVSRPVRTSELYSKTAFALAPQPRTTQQLSPLPIFALDGGLLAQSMTPARHVIGFGQSTSDSLFDIFRSAASLPARPAEFWTLLFLFVVFLSLDIFWDVRFWFLDYPLGCVYLVKLFFFSKLRTVSHLLLNAWLSRVPLVGAQIPSTARGMKGTLRPMSEIVWRGAAERDGDGLPREVEASDIGPPREVEASDNGDGLVGDMEVRLAWRRGLAFARSVFGGDGDW